MAFYELPMLAKIREDYLDDDACKVLQTLLLADPQMGDVMRGTGGLRKMRCADGRRNKGKRGGLRVIYYYWNAHEQIWLFTLYDKDELDDLTPDQARVLKARLEDHIKTGSLL